MFRPTVLLSFVFAALVAGQQVGTYQTETHPRMSFQDCSSKGNCRTIQGSVVLDANWRWAHIVGDYKNCYTDNAWDTSICSSPSACAKNCAIEGVDYSGTYGITTSGNQLNIKFVTKHQYGTNVGGRVYMMESDTKYYMFKLMNREFTFDVDVSQLGCGFNGALYFVSMPQDGGMTGNNKAGAKYGTGYCDAQCPHDMKWIGGEGNTLGWEPSADDKNAGRGQYGTCCDEMDIWEANSVSTAFTPHTCSKKGACKSASECGDNGPTRYEGVCDKDGCDFNSYRLGERGFYGKGKTVDTSKKMTVVTQFITTTGTDSGDLKEIRRIYVQGGKVIQNSFTNIEGMGRHDSITMDFCDDAKNVFNDNPHYQTLGGHRRMGQELRNGMVLAMSIWGDFYARMLWLDSSYPLDRDPEAPGIARGECPQDGGDPNELVEQYPNTTVMFSNVKVGALNSTY